MIQVRDTLKVRFGKIDQAVALFSGAHPAAPFTAPQYQLNVLTDISGPMYTLINEFVAPSLGAFEAARDEAYAQPQFDEWFGQFQQFIEGGRREYFTIEGDYRPWSAAGMIVVRETYHTFKWQIETTVALLKRYGALLVDHGVGHHPRVLTDASGPMFRVVIETETESMSTWERQRRSLYQQVEFEVWFNQMLTAAESGAHDFYRVEYTHN